MKTVLEKVNNVKQSASKVNTDSGRVLSAAKTLCESVKEETATSELEECVSNLDKNNCVSCKMKVLGLKIVYSGLKRAHVFSVDDVKKEVKDLDKCISEISRELDSMMKIKEDKKRQL